MNQLNKSHEFESSPFALENESRYRQWRQQKLERYPQSIDELQVPVKDLADVQEDEKKQLLSVLRKTNMAVYRSNPQSDKGIIRQFCRGFGLHRLDHNLCSEQDGISALKVIPGGSHSEYIPYSNQAIRWHTDGYYNKPEHTIRGMLLHCVSPALEGGANRLMDPEIAYILIRDTNADFVHALMQADAMTIPANIQKGVEIRPRQSGPVFSINASGDLHMRYTARTRSIEWKQDSITKRAVQTLVELLSSDSPYLFGCRLEAGQGLLSNNVLHTRTSFTDGDASQRLMYRARFYDRITGTGVND